MRILDRYVLRNFFEPFVLCFLGFLGILIIFDLNDNLGDFLSGKARLELIAVYYAHQIPHFVLLCMPVGLLLALLYSLSKMSRSNEIISILTAGRSVPRTMSGFVLPALQVAGEAATLPSDNLSHGTSMAETILHGLNLAPKETGGSSVRILPVDIYGGNEDTTTFDVAKGIYAAINSGATIINLSLAGDGDSQFLANMIADARKQGVLFFGAAGNEPTTAPTYPAAYAGVVAVTASDRRGNIAPYANRGSFVDVAAPGTSLVEFGGESFIVSGTSASTAYVSGAAAGYRANGQTADQVEAALRQALAVKTPSKPPTANKR